MKNQTLLSNHLITLVNVFNAEGITVQPQSVIESVHVTTFPFRLLNAGKTKVNTAKNLAETIESAIGLSPVRISRKNGLVNVELPIGNGKRIYCERLPANRESMTVSIGLDTTNQLIHHNFTVFPHLAFVGRTNFGKTSNARSVIYQLLNQNPELDVYICAYKRHDWEQFAESCTILTDESDMLEMLKSASDLMAKRGKLGIKSPPVLIVLDDCTQLVDNKEIVAELAHLAPLCRGMGILLLPILQRLSGLDSRFTGNISAKVIFAVASAQDAALLSGRGESGAELLSKQGDALYLAENTPVRLAALSLRDTTKIVNREHGSNCNFVTNNFEAQNADDLNEVERLKTELQSYKLLETSVNKLWNRVEISGRPKTDKEIQYIKDVYALSGSVDKTCKFIYGNKNGAYLNHIKSIVGACTNLINENRVDAGILVDFSTLATSMSGD